MSKKADARGGTGSRVLVRGPKKMGWNKRRKAKKKDGTLNTETVQAAAQAQKPEADRPGAANKPGLFSRIAQLRSRILKDSEPADLFEDTPAPKPEAKTEKVTARAALGKKQKPKAADGPGVSAVKIPVPGSAFGKTKRTGRKFRAVGRPRSKAGAFFEKLMFWRYLGSSKTSQRALAYATGSRHKSKKERRSRRITFWAAVGAVLVTAGLLVGLLVPWGGEDREEVLDASAATATPYRVEETPEPEPTPTVTINPIAIETTAPDQTDTPIVMADLLNDYQVQADLYYNEVGYSNNHYEYTQNEAYMLAQVIDAEARGESFTGKVAVGNVVMNRVLLRGYFGSSITSVVSASNQFAYNPSRVPSAQSKSAARWVLDYEYWVVPQHVYYFHSARPAGEDWGSHKFYKKIGNHCFYTHNYYGRSRINSIPPKLFERTFQWPRFGCKPEKRVYRLQYMLKDLGYNVEPDSYFGMDTVDALKDFQKKKGLEADGIAGPSTIEALIRAFGIERYYQRFYS